MSQRKSIKWSGVALTVEEGEMGTFVVRRPGSEDAAVFDHSAYEWTSQPGWLQKLRGFDSDAFKEELLMTMF
ncbi:MAG: hypothetical protein R3B40_14705 [Polyangiales bacterium]|nr:hypothetical protein [Sandaracinaceae bacterium]